MRTRKGNDHALEKNEKSKNRNKKYFIDLITNRYFFFSIHFKYAAKRLKFNDRSLSWINSLHHSFNFSPLSQRPSENLDHEILKLQSITITITSIIAIIEHRSFLLSTFFSSTSTAFEESRSQK